MGAVLTPAMTPARFCTILEAGGLDPADFWWEYTEPAPPGAPPVTDAIYALVDEWGIPPGEIDNGSCDTFAQELARKVGGDVIGTTEDSSYFAHVFLRHGGRYYDASHPDGVDEPGDLFWR